MYLTLKKIHNLASLDQNHCMTNMTRLGPGTEVSFAERDAADNLIKSDYLRTSEGEVTRYIGG